MSLRRNMMTTITTAAPFSLLAFRPTTKITCCAIGLSTSSLAPKSTSSSSSWIFNTVPAERGLVTCSLSMMASHITRRRAAVFPGYSIRRAISWGWFSLRMKRTSAKAFYSSTSEVRGHTSVADHKLLEFGNFSWFCSIRPNGLCCGTVLASPSFCFWPKDES